MPGMDRLDAMRAFLAVADHGSFAEAARRLRRSPAAITRAVAGLEAALGQTLLHRTTRAVRLTERGAAYRDACRRALEDIAEAERAASGADAVPRGLLGVAAPLMFGRLHVLPIVTALLRAHPALSVRLALSDRILPLAEEGIDVAVRIGALADSALLAVRVAEVRRVLVASPAYLAARGTPARPEDLAGHDLISFEGGDPSSEWEVGGLRLRVEPRLAVNSADAAIAAAESGLGITRTLSYQAFAPLRAGRLVPVLAEFSPPPMPVRLVHPARRQGSANVAAFLAAARAYFAAWEG